MYYCVVPSSDVWNVNVADWHCCFKSCFVYISYMHKSVYDNYFHIWIDSNIILMATKYRKRRLVTSNQTRIYKKYVVVTKLRLGYDDRPQQHDITMCEYTLNLRHRPIEIWDRVTKYIFNGVTYGIDNDALILISYYPAWIVMEIIIWIKLIVYWIGITFWA